MTIEILLLVEDTAHRLSLRGEHGISMLIKTDKVKILFDAGQSSLFLSNANLLNEDLSDLEHVVLSHGHYDHGGGLAALADLTGGFTLYTHPLALETKFSDNREKSRRISLPLSASELEKKGISICCNRDSVKLPGGFLLTGEIPRNLLSDEHPTGFTLDPHGQKQKDRVKDSQALVLPTSQGLIILTGCAHAGILNTIAAARKVSSEEKIRALIGGFHLLASTDDEIEHTGEILKSMDLGLIGPCHCTGLRAQAHLLKTLAPKVRIITTGDRLSFDEGE